MKLIVCDNCRKLITEGSVPVGFGAEAKDACSPACAKALEPVVEGYAEEE